MLKKLFSRLIGRRGGNETVVTLRESPFEPRRRDKGIVYELGLVYDEYDRPVLIYPGKDGPERILLDEDDG